MNHKYTFTAKGHPNILAEHYKTIEINKDDYLTERGDCIIGIGGDFDLQELKKFHDWVDIEFEANGETEKVRCRVNDNFDSDSEFVLRKSRFDSPRTFGFNLSKGSNRINRNLIKKLQEGNDLNITITQRVKRVHKNKYKS